MVNDLVNVSGFGGDMFEMSRGDVQIDLALIDSATCRANDAYRKAKRVTLNFSPRHIMDEV